MNDTFKAEREARRKTEMARGAAVGARAARLLTVEGWQKQGRVKIVYGHPNYAPNTVAVQVWESTFQGGCWYSDPVGEFPSEKLVAQVYLQLELGGGR